MSAPLLTIDEVSMQFGGIMALNNISFSVNKGDITALIGPNGAGKTTLFNCLTGFYKVTHGRLLLHHQGTHDIKQQLGEHFTWRDVISPNRFLHRLFYKMFGGAHRIARLGIARTFQNVRLFAEMTVIENCLAGQTIHMDRNIIHGLLNTRRFKHSEKQAVATAYEWLRIVGIADMANRLAGELPYGHQRRLEIARAMCVKPILLCLDEPGAGLNPQETADLGELIQMLRAEHAVSVLLIEHDMRMVMSLAEHIIVLDQGQIIAEGNAEAIRRNPAVINAYLGIDHGQ